MPDGLACLPGSSACRACLPARLFFLVFAVSTEAEEEAEAEAEAEAISSVWRFRLAKTRDSFLPHRSISLTILFCIKKSNFEFINKLITNGAVSIVIFV